MLILRKKETLNTLLGVVRFKQLLFEGLKHADAKSASDYVTHDSDDVFDV